MEKDLSFPDLDDPGRLASLAATGVMDSQREQRFDRLTRLTAQSLDVPVSLISLVDERRQFFKSAVGLPEPWDSQRETPLTHSFCQHVVRSGAPLVVENARSNSLVCDNLAIPDIGVEAYLGIPLVSTDGQILGSLCAIDVKPRVWTEADIQTLTDFAKLVEEQINLKSHIRELMDIDEARELVNGELTHRIKNIFSVIQSLIRISARGCDNLPDYVENLSQRIGSLARANEYVTAGARSSGGSAGSLIDLFDVLLSAFNAQNERVSLSGINAPVGEKSSIAIALIIHELATNSAKHGALSSRMGSVQLSATQVGDTVEIRWLEKNGPALTGKPEKTGFGSKMTAAAVRSQLYGEIDYDWAVTGLRVSIDVPAAHLAY